MKKTVSGAKLDRSAAADLWRHTLSQIPSVFGRLVYLSSLRDMNTDAYNHHGFAQIFGRAVSDKTLRASHRTAFADWLEFTLEEQKADLDLYLSTLDGKKKTIIEAWLRLTPYRDYMPSNAKRADRELFLTDLEALLTLLKNQHGASSPDPDA